MWNSTQSEPTQGRQNSKHGLPLIQQTESEPDQNDGASFLPYPVDSFSKSGYISSSESYSIQSPTTSLPPVPVFKTNDERLKTFSYWYKTQSEKLIPAMAASGLYYTGKGDLTQCAACGVTIGGWSRNDIPHERHRRSNPMCPFVVNRPTEERLVEDSAAASASDSTETNRSDTTVRNTNRAEPQRGENKPEWGSKARKYWKDDPAVTAVLDMGKSQTLVRQAVFNHKRKELPMNVESLLDEVLQLEDEHRQLTHTEAEYKHPKLRELYAINKKLKKEATCILCSTGERDLLMLPCKHLVTCEDCGEAVENCPRCSKKIMATVKIYMNQ